jgi:sulfur dioxygenase
MLIFRQLFDPTSSTYTYLLGSQGQAVLIDPVFEQARRDSALLHELGLTLIATLDTHVHADHVTAAWLHRQRLGSQIMVGKGSGAVGADRLLQHGQQVVFGSRQVVARATPGHTQGCMSYVLDDQTAAFSGDALLIRGCGRTDFQGGSAAQLFNSVHQQLFSLPDACLIYPGHDYRGLTATSVLEERQHNPRLGGTASVGDFAGYMHNLGLPHPKLIDIAVPANLTCGQPAHNAAPAEPTWGALNFTFAGLWEIEPSALLDLSGRVQLIDVREPLEFAATTGDGLGHIAGSRSLPLAQLMGHVAQLQGALPVVTVCRSGTRSAQAAVLLQRAGIVQVANLAGGLLRWHAEGLPVVGGAG